MSKKAITKSSLPCQRNVQGPLIEGYCDQLMLSLRRVLEDGHAFSRLQRGKHACGLSNVRLAGSNVRTQLFEYRASHRSVQKR